MIGQSLALLLSPHAIYADQLPGWRHTLPLTSLGAGLFGKFPPGGGGGGGGGGPPAIPGIGGGGGGGGGGAGMFAPIAVVG
jgi:hypothetical protein